VLILLAFSINEQDEIMYNIKNNISGKMA